MSQSNGSACRTVLLSDEPESNDSFGPHGRVAKAIADLIAPKDANGLSIGLEGAWGSGKSTVARLLNVLLDTDKEIASVTFDAWAHQGDPLRRTFLETLIRHLQGRTWVDKKNWDVTIEELANRREQVTTKDSLVLSNAGKLVGVTVFLVPIGAALVAAALREEYTLNNTGHIATKMVGLLLVGIICSFAPVIAAAPFIRKSDVLGLLFNKGVSEKTTLTNKTINPTSIEFEETFNKLLTEALDDNKRKLLIVIDNLDRVDSVDALSMWSTLQTFLSHNSNSSQAWRKRLWILVLYDLKGLRLLWDDASNTRDAAAISFIEKRFQIRFEVPAPVLSDWRLFLNSRLKDAFPDHTDEQFHDVYRALEIYLTNDERLPSIREIKLYVNQIGAIHRQWVTSAGQPEEFSLGEIACYVLLRQTTESMVKSVLLPDFVDQKYENVFGNDLREKLLALALNVDIVSARQMVFSAAIRNALQSGSAEELIKIQTQLPKGFWEVVEKVLAEESSNSPTTADAAVALDESKLLAQAPQPAIRSMKRRISEMAAGVISWSPWTAVTARGIGVILTWKAQLSLTKDIPETYVFKIFSTLAAGFRDEASRRRADFNTKSWLESLETALGSLQPNTRTLAFTTLAERLAQSIDLKEQMDGYQLQPILELLSELANESPDPTAMNELKRLVDDKRLAAQIQMLHEPTPSQIAWCLYAIARYGSGVDAELFSSQETGDGKAKVLKMLVDPTGAVAQTFVEVLGRFNQLPILFDQFKNRSELEGFQLQSFGEALKNKQAIKLLGDPPEIERLKYLFTKIGRSKKESRQLEKLLKAANQRMPLHNVLFDGDFSVYDSRLYAALVKLSDSTELISATPWLIRSLDLLPEDEWFEQLTRGGDVLFLAQDLQARRTIRSLGSNNYLGALTRIAQGLGIGALAPPIFETNPAALLGDSTTPARLSFRQTLIGIGAGPDTNQRFYDVFGEELAAQISELSPDLSPTDFLTTIVRNRSLAGLKWIQSISSSSELGRLFAGSEFQNFRRELQSRIELPFMGADEESAIKALADQWNIKAAINGMIAVSGPVDGIARITLLDEAGKFLRTLRSELGEMRQPAWSFDGLQIAFTRTDSSGTQIWITDEKGSNEKVITSHRGCSESATWSPDGKSLAFIRREGGNHWLYVRDLESQSERAISRPGMQCEGPCWSSDGQKIAFYGSEGKSPFKIRSIAPDGSDLTTLSPLPYAYDPCWAPDSQTIVFVTRHPKTPNALHIVSTDGDDEEIIQSEKMAYHKPIYSQNGERIIYQGEGNLYTVDLESKQLTMIASNGNFEELSWQILNRIL